MRNMMSKLVAYRGLLVPFLFYTRRWKEKFLLFLLVKFTNEILGLQMIFNYYLINLLTI